MALCFIFFIQAVSDVWEERGEGWIGKETWVSNKLEVTDGS